MRIRATVAALCFLTGAGSAAHAQDPGSVDLEVLRTPTSPVFALIGKAPVSIERPTTVHAFTTTLLTATGNLSRLPDSYAIDVGPYWLTPRPTVTFEQFYRPSVGAALAQTFVVSLATAPIEGDGDERLGTQAGLGFRVSPVIGGPSAKLQATLDSLDVLQDSVIDMLRARERATTDSARARINTMITAAEEELRRHAVNFASSHYQERVGFKLELAAAALAAFPGDIADQGKWASFGAWSTFSYRPDNTPVEALALGRLIWARGEPTRNALDLGGRFIYHIANFALSFEGVSRTSFNLEPDDDTPGSGVIQYQSSNRFAGIIEYAIGNAGYVFATIGQDHKTTAVDAHPLIALFGVNIALAPKPRLLTTR